MAQTQEYPALLCLDSDLNELLTITRWISAVQTSSISPKEFKIVNAGGFCLSTCNHPEDDLPGLRKLYLPFETKTRTRVSDPDGTEHTFLIEDSLDTVISKFKSERQESLFSLPLRLGICRQLLYALACLDSEAIAHGQLKPSNIFFGSNEKVILSGFESVSILQPSKSNSPVATPTIGFEDSEISSSKSDVFCMGVILLDLLTLPESCSSLAIDSLDTLPKDLNELIDLVKTMVETDPDLRPDGYDAFKKFSSFNFGNLKDHFLDSHFPDPLSKIKSFSRKSTKHSLDNDDLEVLGKRKHSNSDQTTEFSADLTSEPLKKLCI